ncbi:sensor histidine kinase [Flavobacterium haoranii]|uniref:sensor histidine kinase n=1 Tax=Flavobacterium haoranii TaxID=683124 RepID=UPI001D0E25A5|nr:histidine kinase [Flavobacterium haoranii]
MSYLKAQINPHFLFNTLNSIYALTIIKSDEAPNAVLKLSSMMRYVVTESSQDFVPLSKEIEYINDYITLQKLRMNNDVNFSFNFVGNETGKVIAPLILIPFIENAFKYGLNPDEESEIKIELVVLDFNLTLVVKNKMVVDEISKDLKTETGIENTKKHLEYLYPKKYLLEITEIENDYIVSLNINLD